jgi:hypothetical protein
MLAMTMTKGPFDSAKTGEESKKEEEEDGKSNEEKEKSKR